MAGKEMLGGALDMFGWKEVPRGWQFDLLGNRCTIRRGSSPRPAGDPKYFGNGTIPWIKIGDATKTAGRYVESTAEFVNQEGAKHSVRIPPGSLIIANSGVSLGFAVFTKIEGCIHDGWLLLTDFKELDRDYLYYCVNLVTNKIRGFADGTTQPNLNTDIARRLLLPMPPFEEQKKIAQLLGTLDDKIELNRQMNVTLEAMAQALFKSWFADTIQNGIPQDWREGKVEELALLSRATINPSEFPEETFDHYSIPAFDESRLPKAEYGEQIQSNKFIVPSNAVLLSKLNPRIPRVWLPNIKAARRSICSTEFLVTTPQTGVSREYLYALFGSQSFLEVFSTLVTGTSGSHQRVKPEYLLAMDVLIPPKELMARFTETVGPIFQRTAQNIEESCTLANIRDTLLPKLISGELRVQACQNLAELASGVGQQVAP